MRRGEDEVIRVCEKGALRLGVPAPEQKNYRLRRRVQQLYHAVGEDLPAERAVAVRLSLPHGQHCVEQKDAVFSPGPKASAWISAIPAGNVTV